MKDVQKEKPVLESTLQITGIILALVLLFFLGLAFVQSVVDHHPLSSSDAGYTGPCLSAKKSIQSDKAQFLTFEHYVYPPLYFTISGILLPLDAADRTAGKFIVWFWMIVGIAGFFLLLRLRLGFAGAVLGVTVFVASPMFRIATRHVNMDIAVFALFPWFLFVMLKSRSFNSKGYAALAGMLLGMGFLIRWDFPFLIGMPLLIVLASAIRQYRGKTIPQILLFAVIPLSALVFYLINFADIPTADVAADESIFDDNFSAKNLFLYFYFLGDTLYGIGLSVLAGICLYFGFRVDRKNTLYFLGIFAWVMLIYTMVPNKSFKYMLIPAFLLSALIAVAWVRSSNNWKLIILFFICLSIWPYTKTDWSGIHPEPMRINKEMARHIYIRPVEIMDSNLKEYRKLLDKIPAGEKIVCFVKGDMSKNTSDEEYALNATISVIASYTTSIMDKSFRTKIMSPMDTEWDGCDVLMVPIIKGARPRVDFSAYEPLIITGIGGDSIVWLFSADPHEAGKQ